ncbi:hypothetical protein [Streptomyces prunicolor]
MSGAPAPSTSFWSAVVPGSVASVVLGAASGLAGVGAASGPVGVGALPRSSRNTSSCQPP